MIAQRPIAPAKDQTHTAGPRPAFQYTTAPIRPKPTRIVIPNWTSSFLDGFQLILIILVPTSQINQRFSAPLHSARTIRHSSSEGLCRQASSPFVERDGAEP